MSRKRPVVREAIPKGKHARVAQRTDEDDSLRVSWRFGDADRNGRWAWHPEAIAPEQASDILHFLAEMDKLTWAVAMEGWRPRRKRVEAGGICKEAQERLIALQKEELDELEEWRLSGPERIWGIRDGHVCHVLWWDPEHTVWPSDKA